jgi:L-asparaginase
MMADSRDFGESDRRKILNFVSSLDYDRFVIIHGTSSILETAKLFQTARMGGVYVFTGAMTPFRYSRTEAAFNLGGAIALARCKSQGVFLNMHGEVFDPSRSHKDETKARFFHATDE